ncbi:MAG: phosphatidate cytidylyltransferase [Ferrimicrobium sp.]|jgi:phosphatidate cytidylyltransferase|nr:phosphatidate cytidylyltransferase [Ferrimicrobium sp.]
MGEGEERRHWGPEANIVGGSLFDDAGSGDEDATLVGAEAKDPDNLASPQSGSQAGSREGDEAMGLLGSNGSDPNRANHSRADHNTVDRRPLRHSQIDDDETVSLGDPDVTQVLATPGGFASMDNDVTVELPSWREPPTGEIPRVIAQLAGEPLPPLHAEAAQNFDALEDDTPYSLSRAPIVGGEPADDRESTVRRPRDDNREFLAQADEFFVPVERFERHDSHADLTEAIQINPVSETRRSQADERGAERIEQAQMAPTDLGEAPDGEPESAVAERSARRSQREHQIQERLNELRREARRGDQPVGSLQDIRDSPDTRDGDQAILAGLEDSERRGDPEKFEQQDPHQQGTAPEATTPEANDDEASKRPTRHDVVSSRRRPLRQRGGRQRLGAPEPRSRRSAIESSSPAVDGNTEQASQEAGGSDVTPPARPGRQVKAVRVVTGIILAVIFLGALKLGVTTTVVVVTIAVVTAAGEGYNLLRKGGYRPASLVGLLAVIGLVVGAYVAGEDAIVVVMVASILVSLVWFMVQRKGELFVSGVTTTMVMVVWVGLFGSFAGLLLRPALFGSGGLGLLVGTLLCATAADVFAFAGGSLFGKHKLAPAISPGKTVEGVVIGGVAALVIGALFVPLIHPFTLTAGLAIGIVAALIAPVGDLAESALKRSVSAKDSSRLLPGHGGMLDRIDGILIVLPVAFYLFLSLHLR